MTILGMQSHLMHMRYLVYKQAIGKAIRDAHEEMRDYAREFAAMVARAAR